MIARFPGICKACGRPYAKGERIAMLAARGPRGGRQWGHAPHCPTNADRPAPAFSAPQRPASCSAFRWTTAAEVAASVDPADRRDHESLCGNFDAAVRLVTEGDHRAETVATIARARESARNVLLRATDRPAWSRDFAGYAVSVPHLLAGSPRCMIRPTMEASMTAPLRLWIDPNGSSATPDSAMLERAGVLAGIAEALSERRPVEVVVFDVALASSAGKAIGTEWRHVIDAWCVRVDWRDPASLAALLGNAYARGVSQRAIKSLPGHAPGDPVLGSNEIKSDLPKYVATLRSMLPGAGPDDLVIPYQRIDAPATTPKGILQTILNLYGAEATD